ncbi:MAG TPA: NAD-dependent epimerase/dehydratase family protein [Jatrophihabitans sp.]|jgi:NAD(P)-dependent dehydrogenase (short-subunit alcohol dehydrogenase family)
MTNGVDKIVAEMREVAPPGQHDLDLATTEELGRLTDLLLEADPTAIDEYERYLEVMDRELDISGTRSRLLLAYRGRRVLVTGGTGCIGSMLIRELMHYQPAEVFCFYTLDNDFEPVPGVVYTDVDLQDEAATRQAMREVHPDVVFHCAAQRSPWLAEREIALTVRSNVLGTRNVLRGARDNDVINFVYASTGKAMRYYTTDVYAASKKVGEWLVHEYAEEGRCTGAARFTHVVDNAVLLEKLRSVEGDPDGVMRVHGEDVGFYVQSAIESAQLMLIAGLQTGPGLQLLAIRDLGYPPDLLRVVLGHLQAHPGSAHPAIYLSGHDKGYEPGNPPGLYDPSTATELSPLINGIEARTAQPMPDVPDVDAFRMRLPNDPCVGTIVDDLATRCDDGDPLDIAAGLAAAVQHHAEAVFDACPDDLFTRLQHLASTSGATLPTTRRPDDRDAPHHELRQRQVA